MNIDEIKYSINSLRKRKLRSLLSVLSILIGIAAVFTLISFGLGIQNYIDTLGQDIGVNKLFVQAKSVGAPGTDPNFYLTDKDIDYVKKVRGVDKAVGMYAAAGKIDYKDEIKYVFIAGVDSNDMEFSMFSVNLEKGRELSKNSLYEATLGYNYQLDGKMFEKGLNVGDNFYINDQKFKVIGFYEEIGNPSDDSQVYITHQAFESIFPESKNKFGYILVETSKGFDPSDVANRIEEKLRKFKGQEAGKEDFYVQTFDDLLATFSNIVNVLNGVLILIALISIVIATVNIMNTMYSAVLERTKEVGIMKAIGARNNSILSIFVFESGFLGFLGGLLGIIVGFIISKIGGQIAANAGYALLHPIFPWYLILTCLVFSTLIGSLAGLLPARQAAKSKPVESLRYE